MPLPKRKYMEGDSVCPSLPNQKRVSNTSCRTLRILFLPALPLSFKYCL